MATKSKWSKLTPAQQHEALERLDKVVADLRDIRKTMERPKQASGSAADSR
jgi:uncharacterized protein (DUF1778 family)